MAQRLSNSYVNTNRPGSYFDVKVRSTPVGVASSGNIVIIGESSAGKQFADEVLKDNFYTPDQLDRVLAKYVSGPIVDAFRALSSPSSDADITGSANRIYIAKTNDSSKASAVVANAYGVLSDKNLGLDGNKYYYQVTQLEDEVGPSVSGITIPSLGAALSGVEFSIRVDGGAEVSINAFTGVAADYDTIGEIVALIDAALPAGLSAVAGAAADSVKIQADVDSSANQRGHGKSFELIDSTPGDLSALGLDDGVSVSSQEPKIQLDIKRADNNTNESFSVEAQVALLIGYAGTTATVTIDSSSLSTAVTGGAGANLSVVLAEYTTVKDLADFINSQTGYSCSVVSGSGQNPTSALDQVSAVGICSTASSAKPGRIKKSIFNFTQKVSQSASVDFEATASKGLADEMSNVAYLSGGTLGATLAVDVINAIDECETIAVNFVVPLFSRNAASDIADALTDSGSTYTVAAVNAAVKSHVLKMSTAKIKKHRTAFLSIWDGSFSSVQAEAASLSNARISLCFQKTSQVNSQGSIKEHMPWHTAAIAAGMQAGGFYKAIVNKFANVISFKDPSGFDSGSPGDIETALDNGLLFMEKGVVGNKWVSDQTTYGVDTNFVYNSIQAMYAADLVSLDLAASFQTAFVGKSLADVDASTGLSFLASKMDLYKKQKLIAASDDAPLGFKNARVEISGPIMSVAVEIKLATAIYFIPISIEISQVSNNAG
jgi:hypothetical protein